MTGNRHKIFFVMHLVFMALKINKNKKKKTTTAIINYGFWKLPCVSCTHYVRCTPHITLDMCDMWTALASEWFALKKLRLYSGATGYVYVSVYMPLNAPFVVVVENDSNSCFKWLPHPQLHVHDAFAPEIERVWVYTSWITPKTFNCKLRLSATRSLSTSHAPVALPYAATVPLDRNISKPHAFQISRFVVAVNMQKLLWHMEHPFKYSCSA